MKKREDKPITNYEDKPITNYKEYKRRLLGVNFIKISVSIFFILVCAFIFLILATNGKIITDIFGVKIKDLMDYVYGAGYILITIGIVFILIIVSIRFIKGIIDYFKDKKNGNDKFDDNGYQK